ncbi:hypothetical protein NDU88_002038 [Pleurodeles waltl]|uniref:Uncharacterized protein n=1 Tax=Pleurodeles waltl TaxID=8319 RepID=A0AAV7Q610_PLEWA|nr:hypothetical protein NDU88_002038 [Pleurodeles waltl]
MDIEEICSLSGSQVAVATRLNHSDDSTHPIAPFFKKICKLCLQCLPQYNSHHTLWRALTADTKGTRDGSVRGCTTCQHGNQLFTRTKTAV